MKTRRFTIPFLLVTTMALVSCALCVALGLLCNAAYGESPLGNGEETESSTLMAGSIDDSVLQAASKSKAVTYDIGSGSCLCIDPDTEYTIIGTSTDGSTVTIKGGNSEATAVHVTLDNVRIDQGSVEPSISPVTVVSGYAVIKLRGTNVLKAGYKRVTAFPDCGFAGLCVPKGATCIITSADGDGSISGSLEAHGGHDKYGGAGIGTNYDDDTGSIYINGGTIKAYGAHCAAGIGSGRDGECYTVCIQGGDVWAWGGEYAAGIGGGDAVGVSTGGTTHDLWIHGGTVHAYGGNNGGAGIGGSEGGGTDKITITGGTITAYGCGEHGSNGSAAGIGSGDGKECGTIKIDQGSGKLTIDAKGCGEGAGIGGANCKSGTINIKLSGGTITATGGPEAAGIGSGDDESGTISIKGNGAINAYAGFKSAAIGAGDQGHSGPITISGNSSRLNINAYAPKPQNPGENFVSYAAIIGAGDGSAGDISINNANINLNGSATATIEGAGIGTGSSNDLSMKDGGIGSIAISNAKIRFYSIHKMDGAGIGAGYGSNINAITLDNVDYEGPTIGSSCSDRFGTDENSMDSISISNSNIKAFARGDSERNHAGIGTGPYGTIESITISNSYVEAKGVYGGAGIGSGGMYVNPGQALHFITSDDGKCGSVTITGPGTVKATGSEGGAGIGSGTLTSVKGNISISRGVTVIAIGGNDSGAGIGGGKLCSCKDIIINGATVTATGGPAAAAIGSGGISDATVVSGAIQTTWNTVCGNISISGNSNVKATGGAGAAGIGLGQGAQMESGSWITIDDSEISATGGARGAGIGAGCESGLGRGAEARRIKISGKSKVNATGGAGAAGIGGGYEGGLEQCSMGLSVNDPSEAFIMAHGGTGAAGIGAGASSRHSTSKGTLDNAHDAKSITISGGFISAYGGAGSESSEEGRSGAGAGIGGGSYQGDLEGCTISGGVVIAHKGAKATGAPSGSIEAQDIGHGGSREGGGDGSGDIRLTGGTVIGNVSENNAVIVCGGNVTHSFTPGKAVDAHHDNITVYQNALTVDTSSLGIPFFFDGMSFYYLGPVSTSAEYYKGDSVFAVAEGGLPANRARAYLYLPAGGQNATTASCAPTGVALGYYGTTAAIKSPDFTNNTNVLKMGAPIAIVPKRRSDPLVEGSPYIVRVGDLNGNLTSNDTARYTSATNATFEGYKSANGQIVTDLNAVPIYTNYPTGTTYTDVTVIPGDAGTTMRITAKLNGASTASDIYWGDGEAFFEKTIEKAPIYVEITNEDELTKVYDGTEIVDPVCQTNGTVTKTSYMGYMLAPDGSPRAYGPTSEKPREIGNYSVTVWATLDGKTATDTASFKIKDPSTVKRVPFLMVDDPSKTYDMQPVEPIVWCMSDGQVELSYYAQGDAGAYDVPLSDAPKDVGSYTVSANVHETAKYEAKSTDPQRFDITPKDGTLALSANGDGNAGTAEVTALLSDVYEDVEGSNVSIALDDGNPSTARLVSMGDGTFAASCTFDEVGPGHHTVSAGFVNQNYRVNTASAEFDAVQIKIVEDPTKFYDGNPVADPKVVATAGANVSYAYSSGSAPKEPGVYFVKATATLNESSASDMRLFLIRKNLVELSVEAEDKVYDGKPATVTATAKNEAGKTIDQAIELSYYERLDDGSFGTKLDSAPVDIGNYFVKATTTGDAHYRSAEATAAFAILEKPVPFLFVEMPDRIVYDAQDVEGPLVWSFTGEEVVTYYDEHGMRLDHEPKDAGRYSVEVTVPETAAHQAASSGRIPFTILRRPALLSISATRNQSTGDARVLVKLAGALADVVGTYVDIDVSYSPPDPIKADSMSAQGADETELFAQAVANIRAPFENIGGSFIATHDFSNVEIGEYKVTARYDDDPNYIVKDVTEHFDTSMGSYLVTTEDKTVTFGDAQFVLQAEVRDSNGSEIANPMLTYTQIVNDAYPMVSDDAAVVGDDGLISVCNAGMSVVRVEVAGDTTHRGSSDYSVITVEQAQLPLVVTAKDKIADGQPAEVAYAVDDGAYPVRYTYADEVTLTYFRIVGDSHIKLDSAPVEIGTYAVVASAKGDRNYKGAASAVKFSIKNPNEPDEPVITPDDPGNTDNPVKPDTKPTSSENPGGTGGTNASYVSRTGDSVIVWPLAVIAVFGFAISAYSASRVRLEKLEDDELERMG